MNTKYLLLLSLLLLVCSSTLFAQPKISVKSFVKQENDLTARIDAPRKDQNGDVCAIIKVVTTQTGFTWDSDRLGIVAAIPKTGEYWIYVPFGAKRLTIQHPQLGILRDYQYPLTIEPATVYILELTTGKVEVTVTQETIGSEWVVITSEPSGADVYIDEKSTGKQTPFSMQYPLGVHTYSLSLDLYHPDAGRFELTPDAGKKKIASTLKPAFGQLKLTSSPESGATVVLNGKPMEQTTPCTIDKIKSGTYPLTVSKTLYHEKTQTVTITDGQTTNVEVVLKPSFGSVYITSSPESGATVTLDDAPTGKVTPCTLDKIIFGNHTVSLRKEWFQPVKKQLVVTEGEKATLDVPMTALYGNVTIATKPEADIYKDGEKLATGTYTGRLSEGIYTFEARKPKHTSDIQKIQITSGEQKTITLSPRPQMGTVEIQSTPIEAIITLDAVNKGTTPATLRNLLVGDYTLTLSLPGYATTTKTITITEDKTEQVNETLVNGRAVTINSEPSGISLFIDGNPVGQTPYSGNLTFGNHTLWIQQGEKKAEKPVSISQTDKETTFNLSFGPQSFTETINGVSFDMVAIKGGTFQMGSNDGSDDEKPIHNVTVSNFHIGKTEVTQAQWIAVMGSNPSYFKGDNLPVEQVSWDDVKDFIGKLNAKTVKTYRLPTEAEWEYAAGGGSHQKWAGINTESSLGNYAWYDANSGSKIHLVGTKQFNKFGLYDMTGNVWEWCNDLYLSYPASPPINSKYGSKDSYFALQGGVLIEHRISSKIVALRSGQVIRGGSWALNAQNCRTAYRDSRIPDFRSYDLGFRLAIVP